jgi:Type II secretory pathway, ATPase PulE/Tfp pilus assembly pathway, ATPase PilB
VKISSALSTCERPSTTSVNMVVARLQSSETGLVSDDMITAVLSRQYGIPSVNLDLFHIDESVLRLIPQEVAQKHSVLPLSRVGATLTLAMVDPTNVFALDDVKFMTGLNVEPVVVAEASIQHSIAKYYGTSREIELAAVSNEEVCCTRRTAMVRPTVVSLTRSRFSRQH